MPAPLLSLLVVPRLVVVRVNELLRRELELLVETLVEIHAQALSSGIGIVDDTARVRPAAGDEVLRVVVAAAHVDRRLVVQRLVAGGLLEMIVHREAAVDLERANDGRVFGRVVEVERRGGVEDAHAGSAQQTGKSQTLGDRRLRLAASARAWW